MLSVAKLFDENQRESRKKLQMFLNTNKDQQFSEMTIIANSSTIQESLVPLISYMAQNGNTGHSYEIVVDPESSADKKSFGFDGDGSHFIKDILVNGKRLNNIIGS